MVWKTQRLYESFCVCVEPFMHTNRCLVTCFAQNHLLELIKFMDSNQALCVFAMSTCLPPKTGRERQNLVRQFFSVQDVTGEVTHCSDLGSTGKIFAVLCLVQVLFPLRQGPRTQHIFSTHKRRYKHRLQA